MTFHDYLELSEEEYTTGTDDNASQWTEIRIYDWWETFGPDGNRYSSGPTRDAAILNHENSNARLKAAEDQVNKLRIEVGEAADYDVELVPVAGARHMRRYEANSGWERAQESETLAQEEQ